MDHKLDKYFREQLSQREHPFQEAYWEAARTLLQRRKRRRRLFFWLFFGTGVIAAAWLLWPVSENSTTEAVAESVIAQRSTPAENETEPTGKASAEPETTLPMAETAGISADRTIIRSANWGGNHSTAVMDSPPSVNEEQAAPAPSKRSEQKMETGPPANATAQTETPLKIENLPALPHPTPEMLPLPWEQRFVKPLERKSKAWLLQNWSVELSQVFTAEHRQPLNRNGYRLALRKDHRLEQGIYLFGSAGYEYRSGTFEASKVAVGRNYRFGLELDSQFLKPNSLHFLELSVGAGFGRKHHQVELSLSPRYLMGVRGERGFYRRVENTHPPEKEFVPVEAGWLVEDGFRRLALATGAAYWFRFNQRTAIGISTHFQPGGLMLEGYSPPVGNYILKESGEWTFRLSARLGF